MDLLSIDDLNDAQVARLFDEADRWLEFNRSPRKISDRLAGLTVLHCFFENSTRTLVSFDLAARRLGADSVTLAVDRSSVKKGETLSDTAATLNAMRPDLMVLRHSVTGAPKAVADIMDGPLINAGDGTGEHPTQALLDAATIRRHFGRIDGMTIAICGDIRHSRVARSNAKLLARLGANLRFSGPADLLPADLEGATQSIDEAIDGADVVMMLRIQRERLEADLGDAPGEYLARHGLTRDRLDRLAPRAKVMHPGPINRDVEIAGEVADDPDRSLILAQVEMGVAMRMACLDLLAEAAA